MTEGYLLDTNICIHLLKQKYRVSEKLDSISDKRLCISEITLAELNYGAYKSGNTEKHLWEVELIASLFQIIPIGGCLKVYGQCKAFLEKQGQKIDDLDLLIGSTAVSEGLTLVTENVRHLERIPNIRIENWIHR